MKKDVKLIVKKVATEKFFRYDYHKVTIDEIAKAAGISKRTLYEHFKSKEEIVKAIIVDGVDNKLRKVMSILDDKRSNELDKIIKLFNIHNTSSVELFYNKELMYKLSLEVPKAFEALKNYGDTISEKLLGLFFEAQKAGYFRNDIDINHVIKIGLLFRELINLDSFKNDDNYSKMQVVKTFNKVWMQGVLSKKMLTNKSKNIEALLENIENGNEKNKKINK